MVFQLMSAVALFVVIAVALYFQISDAQLLGLHTFVHSFDKPFANLMEYKFFQFLVDDTVYYIVIYIGNSVGVVVVNTIIWNRWPKVHAQAGVEQNTTAPVVTAPVVTAPVVTAPVVTAPVVLATVAPVVTGPVVTAPVVRHHMAPDPVQPAPVLAPVDPVVTAQLGFATGNNLAGPAPESSTRSIMETSRCVMVQQNARKAEREAREAEKKRRLDAAAAHQR